MSVLLHVEACKAGHEHGHRGRIRSTALHFPSGHAVGRFPPPLAVNPLKQRIFMDIARASTAHYLPLHRKFS